ncbi:hypothetical protein, partial [Luteitalea sp.]|uniref:hypothetical protein n=1 Tax=Luteitalea sp. TaxID=2004800 RepID=UPI0025C70DB7
GAFAVRLGKRGRLPEARAPGGVELILQPIMATLQPIPFVLELPSLTLGPRQHLAQSRDLVLQSRRAPGGAASAARRAWRRCARTRERVQVRTTR